MKTEIDLTKFDFLKNLAMELGASAAKVISANEIIVEHRVVLKCKIGCKHYGKTLMCPPYSPSVDDFKKTLSEYSYALVLKFKSQVDVSPEVAKLLSKNENDPSLTKEMHEKIHAFWDSWKKDKLKLLKMVRDLEKAAMNKGYPLALGFTTGSCLVCEKCDVEKKVCIHPTEARYTAQSVGVNIKQTLDNASMSILFPMKGAPETFGLVLID
ncbi:MAG: metal-binding protein [Candidatus Bathyarchaeum sp.]|nr:MAG: metal-binding protein [Candidatus Bathyarchaeum sp.]